MGHCSYLSYPRIHFAGQFRADSDTRNNDPCNYDPQFELNLDTNGVDWGFNGTNEFQFFDTEVTSVYYGDGTMSTSDPVVGRGIVGNLERPFAKLTDLDVDCQDHSSIYGLKFGIQWSDDHPESDADLAFYGSWTRNVVAQSMWPRLKCYSNTNYGTELFQDSFPLGGQATTTITGVDWGDVSQSQALQELKSAAGGRDLAVRITFYYYTRNYPTYVPYNATLGYVVGVIGVPSDSDTLNVPGERVMSATGNVPEVTYTDPNDLCNGQNLVNYPPWMNDAPFEVDEDQNEVHFDLSNSVPSDLKNVLRSFGTLRLGILMSSPTCVLLLGDEDGIPYDSNDRLHITSAIYTIEIDPSLMDEVANNPLVIVQVLDGDSDTQICAEILSRSTATAHTARILLQEPTYYIRPQGYTVDRLERVHNPSSTKTLYVTKYGVPAPNVGVQLSHVNPSIIPENGVTPTSFTATADANGFVNFVFNINAAIPEQRQYASPINCRGTNVTTLPIDGQIYYFQYCVNRAADSTQVECSNSGFTLVFLAFSDISNDPPYNWVEDVGPILSQYARLTRVMDTVLDMSSYAAVTKHHNINLMKLTLGLDFEDPSYMPTTRDLSTAKKNMILEWLEDPLYDSTSSVPGVEVDVCEPPNTALLIPDFTTTTPRCSAKAISFTDVPQVLEPYYQKLFEMKGMGNLRGRPLFGRIRKMFRRFAKFIKEPVCSRENVVEQLQTAVSLEWATLPPYLTSLYSIVEGCNTEIYGIIRSITIQEMLHFTQSANILIAMGEDPVIDSPDVTPSYPTRLPGDVLPKLVVTLEKLSLEHIHRVFMGIELPQKTEVAGDIDTDLYTIGVFYEEISDCIEELGDDIFDPSTVDQQVKWPWDPTNQVGDVVPITDAKSARDAIEMITAQGEGEGLLDPSDIGNYTLAHFFKFEEIVCQKHLEEVSEDTYAYTGADIPFRPDGVWPMRSNPTIASVPADTNCYTESRVFHQAYRALLHKLQEVFTGRPDEINNAITLMESLQVHAKKLMWTKLNPDSETDDTTCGPVWDYYWPED